MKRAAKSRPAALKPTEDQIRAYAYRLYVESGCIPGRDLDNWREAEDRLRSMSKGQEATARGQPHHKRD